MPQYANVTDVRLTPPPPEEQARDELSPARADPAAAPRGRRRVATAATVASAVRRPILVAVVVAAVVAVVDVVVGSGAEPVRVRASRKTTMVYVACCQDGAPRQTSYRYEPRTPVHARASRYDDGVWYVVSMGRLDNDE